MRPAAGALALCGLFALACGGTDLAPPRVAPSVARPSATPAMGAAAPAPPQDLDAEAELDLLVGPCVNSFAPRAYDSRERYLSWVDRKTGPTGREPNVYGLYELNGTPATCRENVGRLRASSPADPELDDAAQAWVDALTSLDAQIDDVAPYYELTRYRDDGFGRGRAMHEPLMQAFERFATSDRALVALIEVRVDRLDDAATDRLAAQPKSTEGVLRRMIRSARGTMATLSRVHETPDQRLDGPLPEIETRMRDLAAATDALAAWQNDRLAPDVDGLDRIVDAGRKLEGGMRNVAHLVRAREPMSDTNAEWCGSGSGWMVDGCPDQVASAYDDFVDAVNSDGRIRPRLIAPAHGR